MSNRINIINAEIQKAVSEIITYELQNPLITGIVSVTKVDTTNDLDYSKIYISILTKDNKEDVFNQIKHSAGYIRKTLSQKIDLRKTPYLQFYLDESSDYGQRIDEVINMINEERKDSKDEN